MSGTRSGNGVSVTSNPRRLSKTQNYNWIFGHPLPLCVFLFFVFVRFGLAKVKKKMTLKIYGHDFVKQALLIAS